METPSTTPGPSLDTIKAETEIAKMNVEIAKIMAETIKINRENRWLPFAYGATVFAAAAGFAKLFLH
jgi:hypothetical protein